MTATFMEHVRYRLTDAELLDMGRRVALASQAIEADREAIKEVVAQFKAQIAANEKQLHLLTQLIAQGYEYRDVECETKLDDPGLGQKSVYRKDTGELVKVLAMGDMDRQMRMELQPEGEVPVEQPATAEEPAAVAEPVSAEEVPADEIPF